MTEVSATKDGREVEKFRHLRELYQSPQLPYAIAVAAWVVIAIVVGLTRIPISSDGHNYIQWLSGFSWASKSPCAGYDPGFCALTAALHTLHVPPYWLLKTVSVLVYSFCLFAVLKANGFRNIVALSAIYFVTAWYAYLPLSITEHLSRQYLAGSTLVLALAFPRSSLAIALCCLAGLFHGFAWLFVPAAIAARIGKPWIYIGLFALLSVVVLLIGTDVIIYQIALVFKSFGTAIDNRYLLSIYYKIEIYSNAWGGDLDYPDISFRGALIVIALLVLLHRDVYTKNFLLFATNAFLLWLLFSNNDLMGHRVYHYFRELCIFPAVLGGVGLMNLAQKFAHSMYVRYVGRDECKAQR